MSGLALCFDSVSVHQAQMGDLTDATFLLRRGEAVALAGLNTSGRKTIFRLLVQPAMNYGGSIFLCRREQELRQYRSAHEAGIFPVFSGLLKTADMTLLENLMIHPGARLLSVVRPERIGRDYQEMRREMGCGDWLPEDLNTPLSSLSDGQRIAFELLKACIQQGDVAALFDLPTVLGEETMQRLCALLTRMKGRGMALLCEFDEHFPALEAVTDRVVVMRYGCTCGELWREPGRSGFDMDRLGRMTMGRPFADVPTARRPPPLERTGWEIECRDSARRLTVYRGRIIGLCCAAECVPGAADGFLAWLDGYCRLFWQGAERRLLDINDAVDHKVAVIPRSAKEILEQRSPIENVTLLALRRMPRVSLRYQKMCAALFDDVTARYPILKHCRQWRNERECRQLPQEVKFELGLARNLVLDPEIVVFPPTGENDLKLSGLFRALFEQLAEEGKAVFVFSVSRGYLERACDEVFEIETNAPRMDERRETFW